LSLVAVYTDNEQGVKSKAQVADRAVRAAEAALLNHSYVSAIDVLGGMGLLAYAHVASWRQGRIDSLLESIQANPEKVAVSIEAFRRWALERGLKPSETQYVRNTRDGVVNLRFTAGGDPEIEKIYRTHYVSPDLPEPKQKRLKQKLDQAPKPVVFQVVRDSQCGECGAAIEEGSFLLMDAGEPLCLACARLDDLEFLPSGDTALTRRSTKYSGRVAVVVRFSRSRNRYERQGILVEAPALEKAEQECTEDAEERAFARKRGAERRVEEDRALVARMAQQIGTLFPGCPPSEAEAIARHTAQRGSGRVGRTEAGRKLDEKALTLAVGAAIRHNHTDYDELLASGLDRASARGRVGGRVEEILSGWRR
jgi:hypothetical protein